MHNYYVEKCTTYTIVNLRFTARAAAKGVLAMSLVNGRRQISTPHRPETPKLDERSF